MILIELIIYDTLLYFAHSQPYYSLIDLLIRSQMLYPAELRVRKQKRTFARRLELPNFITKDKSFMSLWNLFHFWVVHRCRHRLHLPHPIPLLRGGRDILSCLML